MSQLNKAQIPLAVEHHTKLDLPFDHATTSMFMLLQPVYYRHTMKRENLHLKFSSVVRPNPIVIPTFGRLRQNIRHFFVPYRLVFPNWDDFSAQTIASNYANSSQVSSVPYTTPDEIVTMFFGTGTDLANQTTSTDYDFKYASSNWLLTRKGRHFYKILYSLGYDILPADKQGFRWNMLALLAYARVYLDWYANSQYLNSAITLHLEQIFKYNDPTSPLKLTATDIYQILSFILPALYNTNGYFEAAWDTTSPGVPVTGQYSAMTFRDPTVISNISVLTNSLGNAEMYQGASTVQSVGSQYLHTALQKLQNYQRRHALAGARSIDRILAEYGFQPENLRINRSIYIGVMSNDIDIKSIFATANGTDGLTGSVVGDYAGAGLGAGSGDVQFQNDEEGIIISIQSIQPSGGYYQGYDRNNRHISRSEFFVPDFDTLGVQPIEKGEVYVSRDLESFAIDATAYTQPFGFTGRYGEYKRSINRVSGDLSFDSVLAGGSAWHLMRSFSDRYFNGSVSNVVHTEDFCRGTDAENYMRLFTYKDYEVDPFNVFIHVDATSYAPCASLTDGYEWDLDTKKVTMDSNGPKLN